MERLPNEILLLIFEWLPSRDLLDTAGRVCRRWASLVARRAVAVRDPRDLRGLQHLIVTIEVTLSLDSLRIFLNTTIESCPNLRNLTVNAANAFTSENLDALKLFRHLKHLDIFIQSRLLDVNMIPVMLRLTSLVINETVCPGVLRALTNSRRLRELHMYGRALYYPASELRDLLRVRRRHLRELTLRCIELQDPAYEIISQCKHLTSLRLYSCWPMTIKGAMHIVKLQHLQCLHITGARMVRPKAMVTFIEHLPSSIVDLALSATWFSDFHVCALMRSLPGLKALEYWRCSVSTTNTMLLLKNMHELQTLDVDVPLSESDIRRLREHCSLTNLRCSSKNVDFRTVVKANGELLRVWPVWAKYEKKYIRASGEGYQGGLFYFWTQKRDLRPLPQSANPAFDYDDADF